MSEKHSSFEKLLIFFNKNYIVQELYLPYILWKYVKVKSTLCLYINF